MIDRQFFFKINIHLIFIYFSNRFGVILFIFITESFKYLLYVYFF